jgi:hypothetical protein
MRVRHRGRPRQMMPLERTGAFARLAWRRDRLSRPSPKTSRMVGAIASRARAEPSRLTFLGPSRRNVFGILAGICAIYFEVS